MGDFQYPHCLLDWPLYGPLSRYSTLTNEQMNLLLHRITEAKRVQTLDLLGVTVTERAAAPGARHLDLLQCAAIHFNHVTAVQAQCLANSVFHFTRHIQQVSQLLPILLIIF